jgi:hypothetical protein
LGEIQNFFQEKIICLEIFRFLNLKEKIIFKRVCKFWNQLLEENYLWRQMEFNLFDFNESSTKE